MPRRLALICLLLLFALPARAVIVRGKVTDALGHPLPGARVQLISLGGGPRNAADTISGYDGEYELRTDLGGRFVLLTAPSMMNRTVAPQVSDAFYGGRTDLLTIDIALDASSITPENSALGTLRETPLQQLSDVPLQLSADALVTQADVLAALRPVPGVLAVEQGQTGSPAQLLLRGAPVTKTVVDGVSAEELGGRFNLATVTSSGLAAIASTTAVELAPDANPLFGVDAQGGVLAFNTPVAATLHPVLIYSGDAGGLSTVRNEAVGTLAYKRADALLSFARYDTDNDEPAQRLHRVTSAANLGYHISANTSLRATLRDDVGAAPLPSSYSLYGIAPATKLAEQNLYGSFTLEGRTAGNWHNLLRYGLARERAQAYNFATPASGKAMTFTGANGYSASGTASFLPLAAREDIVTNRDEYGYQTDYPFKHYLKAVVTARYQAERAADVTSAQQDRTDRTHFSVAASLQGELRHRFFYAASGFVDHATVQGWRGSPSLGLTYVPVLPGLRKFHGTSLHVTAATGVGETSVLEAALVAKAATPRSRTFEVALDQSILPRRLDLRAIYFHNQFSHQVETLNLAPITLSDALAYRTQGLEAALEFHPVSRFLASGGFTYLASVVERSAAIPVFNPNLPGTAIGASTALVGARLFNRAPSSGFVSAQYTASSFSAAVKGTFASRSDGSTNLVLNPTLLLPNRNLSPGYAAVDASLTYSIGHSIMLFGQLDNLFDQRRIAPAGYVSTPFVACAGIRVRLGRE